MGAFLIALISAVAFLAAYHTYGRYLARRIFGLDTNALVPSQEVNDGQDYVPTKKSVIFGHHFTSIAGTGPIVGPAIAVFWGWLPALLWVVLGAILVGAVHDFGTLVVSLRSRGQSLGDAAGRLISSRARILLLLIMFFTLALFMGILGLVIAVILTMYPGTVLALWISMPLAVAMGIMLRRSILPLPIMTAVSVFTVYLALYIGVRWLPISLPDLLGVPLTGAGLSYASGLRSAVVIWTILLMAYSYVASVLPVWLLLQARDYINAIQLFIALAGFSLGLLIVRPALVAPAINANAPADAPALLPFLFITVACGAISGFHSIVSTGTSSKQIANEQDAQAIGYGGMLLEGLLAVLVILACAAGLGLGVSAEGSSEMLTGADAWHSFYGGAWGKMALGRKIAAFVEGAGNLMSGMGIPLPMAVGVAALMVASFAATSIDTSTRLQRYVIQELGNLSGVRVLTNRYVATLVAVAVATTLAFIPGAKGPGSGGLILWPLFGTTNQLLAGMGFLVVAFYLGRHNKPVLFLAAPLVVMVAMPAWALVLNLGKWYSAQNWLLLAVGAIILCLQVWMVVEGLIMWRRVKGVLPDPLPPLEKAPATEA